MQPFYGTVMELNPCKTIIEVREARVECSYQWEYADHFFESRTMSFLTKMSLKEYITQNKELI